MFDFKHYVPILRWKAAEKDALVKLSPESKGMITPLVELIMPQPKAPKSGEKVKTPTEQLKESIDELRETLPEIPEQILKYWGKAPIFIDTRLIDGSIRAQTLEKLLDVGRSLDLFMVPVVNMIPIVDFESDKNTRIIASHFAKESKHGLCLRLSHSDLINLALSDNISKFLTEVNLTAKDVDLLVDLELINGSSPDLIDTLNNIPDLPSWRTFTVAGGSFPPDLSQFTVGAHRIERFEWSYWLKQITSENLKRKPSFSDYTILHPIYKEPVRGAIPSASIRYTLENKWLVMRGEGGQKKKSAQYLANAQLLSQQPDFSGETFSYGDGYIVEKGKDLKSIKTGSARTWLTAGINHHLALTVSQLSNLS